MNEPTNSGLEADIGVTLNKLTRQLAQAEQRMIRTAQRGENAFRKANQRTVSGFQRINTESQNLGKGTGGASNGLRQMSLQLSQVGQQGQATGNYIQALAIQLPDLALGLGPIGILAGVAAGSLLTLGAGALGASDDMDKLIDSLVGGEVGLNSVRGSLSELRSLQEQYTKAIEASAGASSVSASAVIANSQREFEARREVLGIEIQLLKIRAEEQRNNLQLLKDQERIQAELASQRNTSGIGERFTSRDGRDFFNTAPRSTEEVLGPQFIKDNEKRLLSIRKLNAELELTALAIEESNAALNGEFADITAGDVPDPKTSRSSTRARELKQELAEVEEALKQLEATAASAGGAFNSFLGDAVTDVDNLDGALKKLADTLLNDVLNNALSPVSKAFGDFFTGLVGGVPIAPSPGATSLRPVARPTSVPSFEGGGFTGSGPRSGGVDGRGGFHAILHPNEDVIDRTRMQAGGISVSQSYHINGSDMTPEQVAQQLMPLMLQQAASVFARARREGR